MKDGPDIARVAALIGDPARANILAALMSGKALTASELAGEAGVSLQTTSSHLARLSDGGLIAPRKSGRHKYFTLADAQVATVLESLMGLAASSGHLRTRTGPRDLKLRKARVCYNHLAGDMGVAMYQSMLANGYLLEAGDQLDLTKRGAEFVTGLGIDLDRLPKSRTPMCRACLDWSERQSHLAGRLGRAMLDGFMHKSWVVREPDSRVLRFSPSGETAFNSLFSQP
ncbi:winged helix-turn-helix domain-containing protein [Shimia sp.]|uniref:ArsR/SmtB family transcription factor n=1 Tax=Shimia sp. TaxID=1954381 RepID=UPI003297D85B